jgi:hypothetical protein
MRSVLQRVALLAGLSLSAAEARAQAEALPAPSSAPVVVPPKLKSQVDVPYPEGASGDATVTLVLVVAPDGSVSSATPEVIEEPFSSRAVEAALGFRFEPATRDGEPIASKIRLAIVFRAPVIEEVSEEPVDTPEEPEEPPSPDAPIDVEVRGKRPEPSRTVSLSRAEVREIPGAFGDPFRAVEALPGVTPIVSGLPFFFVRGAPPGNVGYFLDGVRVPLLFHVGIGPSVVHPALIERVDLFPGAYPARFGRFAGGVVAGEVVPPDPTLHGEFNLRLFDAGALAEAPFDEGLGTVMVGGRYSYTAALLSIFSPETLLSYWDYQARISYDLGPRDRVSAFAFGSYDYLGEKTQTETITLFGTEFHRVDLRYDRDLGGGGRVRVAATGGLDRSRLQEERYVRDRVLGGRVELELPLSESAWLRSGADVQTDSYDVEIGPGDLSPGARRVAAYFPTRTDVALGAYGDVVLQIDPRFEVTPGVRADLYGSDGETTFAFDPRVALRARASERVSVLGTFGIAHQPPSFVVPVPGFQPGGLSGGLQRALQESLGVEISLGDETTFTATVFQNAFFSMSDPLGSNEPELDGCPPGAYPSDTLGGDRGRQPSGNPDCGDRFDPGTLGPDRTGGGGQAADSRGGRRVADAFEVRTMGSAYGLELLLKKKLTDRVGGFLAYTLSRSMRSYDNRRYVASFDRTHVANAAVAYDLGRGFRAGTRVMFYTGLPKAPDPEHPEATRLPPFFRVDLRLEKRWQLGARSFVSLVAEWMNATLSSEAVSTECTLAGCETETIGPVTIPSLGVEGAF